MSRQKVQRIKGFADLLPPESDLFSRLAQTAREVFAAYGVKELATPILEHTELFARGIGDETDVVQKEMYTFEDKGKRSVTLRPEATAGVVRAFVDSGLYAPERVFKFFTTGPMFRYERPQKGRMRQFHQLNVEVFGADSPMADAELILMLADYLQRVGIQSVTIELNSLGCPDCRPQFHQSLTQYFDDVDEAALCQDCLRRKVTNPLRVLDCKVPGCKEIAAKAPSIADSLCGDCRVHFAAVTSTLDAAGQAYELNPFLVRGLDYYQRTTFEVVATGIGAQASVAGGGRYDGLVELLGGPKAPGVGFALGMERLALLLEGSMQPAAPDFYIAVLPGSDSDDTALTQGLLLARRLRAAGLSGEAAYAAKSLKSQMRLADKLGTGLVVILGPDELANSTALVKDLPTGTQREAAPWADLLAAAPLYRDDKEAFMAQFFA